jgi:hypothetical protein
MHNNIEVGPAVRSSASSDIVQRWRVDFGVGVVKFIYSIQG